MKTNTQTLLSKFLFTALFLISFWKVDAQSEPEIITQDVTLQLDQNGLAILTAEQVDAGGQALFLLLIQK